MNSVKEEVAKNLLYYRKKNKITQKALSEKLGVSHNTVSQWESGTNSIDAELLFKICEIFGVSVNDMYGIYSNVQNEKYTKTERKIIDDFRSLNDDGQAKILDSLEDMMLLYKYKKCSQSESTDRKEA